MAVEDLMNGDGGVDRSKESGVPFSRPLGSTGRGCLERKQPREQRVSFAQIERANATFRKNAAVDVMVLLTSTTSALR
jgi:hypothetical protein